MYPTSNAEGRRWKKDINLSKLFCERSLLLFYTGAGDIDIVNSGVHKEPLVSVIIPVYNGECTLTRAITSALNQKGVEVEVIVVDDGSTDSSLEMAESFGPPVYVYKQGNQGPAIARNMAIRKSCGNYVAFLDADDEWLPGKISRCIEPMFNDSSIGLTYCWSIRKCTDGSESIRNIRSPSRNRLHCILWPDPIQNTTATICARSVFDEVGYFDEALSSREDHDLWIRIGEKYRVVEIPEPLTIVYESKSSYSFINSHNIEKIRADYLYIIDKAFERNPEQYIKNKKAILGEAYRYWGEYALYHGFTEIARSDLFHSMRVYPTARATLFALLALLPGFIIERLRKLYHV